MSVLTRSGRQTATEPSGGFGAVLRGEFTKSTQGLSLPLLVALGVLMSTVTAYGFWEEYRLPLEAGLMERSFVTSEVVRAWMMIYLFAGIAGAQYVTREFRGKVIARTVLAARSRATVFAAKAVVTVVIGLGFGAVATLGAVASALLWPPASAGGPQWSRDAVLSIVGIVVCCVAAALFGAFLGWVVRSQVAAVAIVIILTVMIEPAVQRLWPEGGNALFTIALSAIYRDSHDGLLAIPAAAGVAAGWLVVLGTVGWVLFRRRDVA